MSDAIEMRSVTSGNVKAVGYDAGARVLAVEYMSGGRYHYAGVPEGLYAGLMKANEQPEGSVGRFLMKAVKGKYDYTKIDMGSEDEE